MYSLKPLSYDYDALEPFIGTRTVAIHHDKHEKAYLDRLNDALKKADFDFSFPIVDIITHIDSFPLSLRGDILYNAGGVLNHELYFDNMNPNKRHTPSGALKDSIDLEYGSFEKWKEEFIKSAKQVIGSGWTFLVLTPDKKLQIMNTSNQETPYLYSYIPLLALDLWEHAYYLDYQNNKDEYLNSFFSLVDFETVEKRYEQNL